MIGDLQARITASEWADGGDALQVFQSMGKITEELPPLITSLIDGYIENFRGYHDEDYQASVDALYDLRAYVFYHGIRDEQKGWGNLLW